MLNLSNKAQFFLLTAVIIIGFFYTISKYITPTSFIDTSKYATSGEIFFLNNVRDKAIKTVQISQPDDLQNNLMTYKSFVEDVAKNNGYILLFNYNNTTTTVGINILLQSERMTITSDFIINRP